MICAKDYVVVSESKNDVSQEAVKILAVKDNRIENLIGRYILTSGGLVRVKDATVVKDRIYFCRYRGFNFRLPYNTRFLTSQDSGLEEVWGFGHMKKRITFLAFLQLQKVIKQEEGSWDDLVEGFASSVRYHIGRTLISNTILFKRPGTFLVAKAKFQKYADIPQVFDTKIFNISFNKYGSRFTILKKEIVEKIRAIRTEEELLNYLLKTPRMFRLGWLYGLVYLKIGNFKFEPKEILFLLSYTKLNYYLSSYFKWHSNISFVFIERLKRVKEWVCYNLETDEMHEFVVTNFGFLIGFPQKGSNQL